jgi:rod shape determining protein RodA
MRTKFLIDPRLFIPVVILIIVSLITLLSIDFLYFRNQSISLMVGLVGFLIFSRVNIEFLRQLKVPIYLVSVVLLLIVLFIGVEARGANRWFEIFGVRVQFSEILKPFLALSFASQIADNLEQNFKSFIKIIMLLIPVVLLISAQPDLGSGILYASAGLFALLVMGFSLKWFFVIALPVIFSSPFIWSRLHGYQRQRVLTFLDKGGDPLGTSYNEIQAIIAVGSGSFFGKGISEGTQSVLRFLPERQTDFIFATIAEGLGFFGASIVILAFIAIVWRMYVLFKERDDLFGRSFLAVSIGFFFIQGFVNIAMNIGLVPIVGITFPFVSFGGSSLLANFIFLGLITSLTSSQKGRKVLEIR